MLSNKLATICDYAGNKLGQDFEWGETSCAAFCAGAYDAAYKTGLKYTEAMIACDSTEKALELSAKREGKNFFLKNGFKVIDLQLATTGDIIYGVDDGMECFHLCVGALCIGSTVGGKVEKFQTKLIKRAVRDKEGVGLRCQL
tara:strand:- start:4273 stop:4701 length:429 start_codon:yes stop_codon:yes gene_type:complete